MPQTFVLPKQIGFISGEIAPESVLRFFQTGTSTPQSVYTDAALSNAVTSITADSAGVFAKVYLNPNAAANYRVTLENSAAVVSYTEDDISKDGLPRHEITDAESDAGFTASEMSLGYDPGDARRYLIVPNDTAERSANTAALRKLVHVNGTSTFKGRLRFPNVTGSDVYYFNDIIALNDGIHIDLDGSTLDFTKTAVASDTGSGFIWAIRDFVIENGSIVVDYDMNGVSTSAGYAINIGGRGDDNTTYRPDLWDSLLASPMGNIVVRNVRISSNVVGGGAIALTGGLKGVLVENVFIDGQTNTLGNGIVYEFGWATEAGATNLRETSHMSEAIFRNIRIEEINTTDGIGITLAGAYNYLVENVYVRSAASILSCTTGESLFYRPWAGVDDLCKTGRQTIRNVVGLDISSTSISLIGSQLASGGYLSAIIAALATDIEKYQAQTDLASYTLDGFSIEGSNSSMLISAPCTIRNGAINGGGLFCTDECTRFTFGNAHFTGSLSTAVNLNAGSAIWSPIRQKVGTIRNCFIAGNSTTTPEASPGIEIGNSASILIENNRINYEEEHDGVDETTQGNAVQLAATAKGVVCRGNYVGTLAGASFAYVNITDDNANGNTVEDARGSTTQDGAWLNVYEGVGADNGDADKTLTAGWSHKTQLWATTLTANRAVTLSTTGAKQGDTWRIVRTGLGAFTLAVGSLKTIPSATAAFVDVSFNGTAWKLTGYGTL